MIDLGSAMGRIILDAEEALKSTDKLGRAMGGLGGPAALMGGAVIAAGAAAGGALVALGASSVGIAREFESSMAIMSTAVDPTSLGLETTAQAMDMLGDAALAVGGDTDLVGVSASTSAEAMTGLYKAGLSTGEIFGDLQGYLAGTAELGGALRASIDLAAASELDMVQASELAAITLATFGGHLETEAERAEFINTAMNNFVQTADGSVASVADLQAAFVNIGPTASAMGMGVEEVNTALGILSTRGIVGSEAGTALKSMLVNLQRTTPEVTGTLDELGVSLYDAQGVMFSLPEIIGQLEGAMAGMTEEQRQQTVVTLAGSYGMNAMNSLLGEGTEGWAAMEAAIGGAATMEETAAARTETLAGAQEALSGVWESFQIKVGTALIPVLTMLAEVGGTLLERFGPTLTILFETFGGVLSALFTNISEGMSPIDAFIEAIWGIAPQGVLDALVNLRDNILPGLMGAFETFVQPVIDAVLNFVSLKDVLIAMAIGVGAVVIPAIAGIVTAVAPIALVIGGVIGTIALLRTAWENDWGGIQAKVAAVVGFIGPLIQTVIGEVISWWNTNWPTIQATIQTVWGLIQTVIGSAVKVIRPAIEQIITTAQGAGTKLQELAGPLREVWEKVGPFVQSAATVIGGILTALVGVITGIVSGIAAALDPLIRTFVNVAENIIGIVGGIIEFLTGFFDLLVGLFTGNGEKVQAAFAKMGQGIRDIVGGLVEGVWNLFSGLVETVATLIDGFISGIVEFFQNLYDELVGHSIVVDLVEEIVQWFEDLVTWIGDALAALWEAVSQPFIDMWADLTAWFAEKVQEAIQLGRDIIGGIVEGLQAVGHMITQTIMSFMQAAWDQITSFWEIESPSQRMAEAGEMLGVGFADGIRESTPAVLASMEEMGEALGETLASMVEELGDPVAEMNALFSTLGDVSGLGGGFARFFETGTLDPLRDRLSDVGGAIEDIIGLLGDALPENFAEWEEGAQRLRLQQLAGTGFLAANDEEARARVLLAMLDERGRVTKEYIEQQERLAELEERQAQAAFLQQQLDLLNLIKDNNLSASILEGLEFGLDADAGDLMDAMSAAMMAMIEAAEDTLGIASPSTVFRGIAQQVKDALTLEMADTRGVVNAARGMMSEAVEAAQSVAGRVGERVMDASRTLHVYGGVHAYLEQSRRGVLDDLQEMMSPA